MIIRRLLVTATALSFTLGCSPKAPNSTRPTGTNPSAFVRWIPSDRAVRDAITGIDAPATVELVALLRTIARDDLDADEVSHLQIRFRDYSDQGGLSGILRGYSNESSFALFLLPYQSSPSDWTEMSAILSGPHLLLAKDRVTVLASHIEQWLAGHGARKAVAEDVQLEVLEGKTRIVMRGVLRGNDPNAVTSVAVTCLEGCPE
jgi:hypothetical protein